MSSNVMKVIRFIDWDRKSRVFNDIRSFGRSVKVWGWTQHEYQLAIDLLREHGIKVRIVRTRKIRSSGWGSSGQNLRLWIYA